MFIARLDLGGALIAPPASVGTDTTAEQAATDKGWGAQGTDWRVCTDEEAAALQAPTAEEQYNAERAVVFAKYEAPYTGTSGGIIPMIQMMMSAALMDVPQDAEKIANISNQYQAEIAAMKAAYDVVDQKYGVTS